jgi:hypothetical protein
MPTQSLFVEQESLSDSHLRYFTPLEIEHYFTCTRSINFIDSSDRAESFSFLIPGANGLGSLSEHIRNRTDSTFRVLSLPGNPFAALKLAKSVIRKLSPQKSINIIAHSNGNVHVVPLLVASLQTMARKLRWEHSAPIFVCRLDPIGIPKSTVLGAAQVVDIGSNKPDSRDLRDLAALSFLRPDFRARQGIGHCDLINDAEIFDRLVEPPYNFLF